MPVLFHIEPENIFFLINYTISYCLNTVSEIFLFINTKPCYMILKLQTNENKIIQIHEKSYLKHNFIIKLSELANSIN